MRVVNEYRLYRDLSWLWPMWGSVEEYRAESDAIAEIIKSHASFKVRTFLDVGCGGGKNLCHFKRHFKASGLDMSENMLANCRKLNPECELFQMDMRSFDIGRKFDAICLNDALPHLTELEDLRRVFECAYEHLNPGGVMALIPEFTKENFINNLFEITQAVSEMLPEGMEVTFIENCYDTDVSDDVFEMNILYLIREKGLLRVERDDWKLGLFSLGDWIRLLEETGFAVTETNSPEGIEGYTVLVCKKT